MAFMADDGAGGSEMVGGCGKNIISSRSNVSWSVLYSFLDAEWRLRKRAFDEAERKVRLLNALLVKDGIWEPFLFDLSNNPSFKEAREEKYSDYLAWLLNQDSVSTEELLELFKINDRDSIEKYRSKKPIIRREVLVDKGHEGQNGRVDLLLLFDDVIIDVEVKVVDAENAYLLKNEDYRTSLEKLYPTDKFTHYHRLLVTDALKTKYNDRSDNPSEWYYVIKWREVCLSLRRLLYKGKVSFTDHALFASAVLTFVGSVEQILLGYKFVDSKKRFIDSMSSDYIDRLYNELRDEGE